MKKKLPNDDKLIVLGNQSQYESMKSFHKRDSLQNFGGTAHSITFRDGFAED